MFLKLIKSQNNGHTINQEWLDQLTLAKARTGLDKERSNSKSTLLMIEFARTMVDDNECIVLYFEPVLNFFIHIHKKKIFFRNVMMY